MDRIIALIEGPACQHLVTALLHTLWQGALVAALLFGLLTHLPANQAGKRYVLALVALCTLVLGGLLTWSILDYEPTSTDASSSTAPHSTSPALEEARSAPASPQPAITGPTSPIPANRPWHIWALGLWLAGTAMMLFRVALTLAGARQLRQDCRDLENQAILDLIASLTERMHISRRIRVLVSDQLSVPGVVGSVWPTLLLPVSVTTGMPVDDLKAILTHELAHIKRHDYLVNVIQMVIEALLFFNPAVWWISRQIRIEREACCDATGIAVTGQRIKYAEVLVAWTARLRGTDLTSGVIGFAGHENGRNLVDRIKRITQAGHRPRLNISWPMAGIAIGLCLIGLAGLRTGTNLAVSVAANILTPQERIEQIKEISKTYGYEPGRDRKENSIQVSGTIRTWDGKPLPRRVNALLDVESGQNSFISSMGTSKLDARPDTAEFNTTVARGEFWIMASAKGYAPAAAGPFESRPGQDITDIELTLEQGFTGIIRVVDEAQQPIGNAILTGGYTHGQSLSYQHTISLQTDANGLCQLEHTTDQTMSLSIAASGYEPTPFTSIVLDANETTLLVLPKAHPVTGTVVSRETGLPLPDAEIRLLIMKKATHSAHFKQVESEPDVLTDAQGTFALDKVRKGWQHLIHVTAKGHGHVYLEDIEAGAESMRITLTPKKTIRGTILGDLSQLETDPSGQPVITFENAYTGYGAHRDLVPVTVRDDNATFVVDDVWGQTVTLKAGHKEITLKPEEDDLDNVTFDLRPAVTRDVVLKFNVPEDVPPIQGRIRIYKITHRSGGIVKSHTDWVEIADNQISFKSSAPGQFSYSLDSYGKQPVGYWIQDSKMIDVPPGTEPLVIHVPAYPAGAIYGKIIRPDGSLAKEARASLVTVKRADSFGLSLVNILSNKVELGTYNATPLPLGGTYAIMAYEGYAFAISEPFTLDQAKPIVEVDLRLPKGVTVTGRLLNPDGKPATNPVSLHISIARGESRSGLGGVETAPDEEGRFVFDNVNPGPGGSCTVRVTGRAGVRPIRQEIEDLSTPVIIRLEEGQRVTGTVIDQATGWPIPGLEVYASAAKNAQGGYSRTWELLEAEDLTDPRGQFEFTNMGHGFYRLGVRGANMASPNKPTVVTGGQKNTVTLSVKLPPWSELKPTRPE